MENVANYPDEKEAVNKVAGLLSLYMQVGTEVSENLLRLLTSLGSQIGIAINNARLYQETMNFSLHDPPGKVSSFTVMLPVAGGKA